MNLLTQSKNTTIVPVLIALMLGCFGLSPAARAVDPPPDGGYPNQNTAEGEDALFNLDTSRGYYNTAIGFNALYSYTTGIDNTAIGSRALYSNTTGSYNTATGSDALYWNTGIYNTANGSAALSSNTTGSNNTAIGFQALPTNTTGDSNIAVGFDALFSNTTGDSNIAVGFDALVNNTTGSDNIALGAHAGGAQRSGNHNIYIGNAGAAAESRAIRIGMSGGQMKTFIAGISGAIVPTGVAVIVDASGQLGTTTSSARFKEAIKPMDKASEAILALKPVTFRYKHDLDPNSIPQFGLVAEDVEKVNPDLVARDADGKAYTVRYEAVNAMLLNEFLKEHRKVEQQRKDFETAIARQQKQIEALTAGLQKVSAQLELSKSASQTVLNSH